MKISKRPFHFIQALLLLAFVSNVSAQNPTNTPWKAAPSDRLQKILDAAIAKAREQFPKLGANEFAVTLVDLHDTQKPLQASYRGDQQIYPASVIKLFYLVAAHQWMEEGKIKDTEELRRAMRDMIVDSGNEPTHYIVDLLTDTTSGPELSEKEMEEWYFKRNAVNRYYTSLGFKNINVNRKPWCEGPYGREIQSVKVHKPNHRNWLTTDATARLLSEIVSGHLISKKRCEEMMELLKRDPFAKGNENDQAHAFTGLANLPVGTKLWSKAGWTSETRHDVACLELPDGARFVLVTFTVNHANEKQIIPTIANVVIEGLASAPK